MGQLILDCHSYCGLSRRMQGSMVTKKWVLSNLFVSFRLACRCAEISKQKGFTYFGLQDYGRCFSSPHAASTYSMHGSSNRCSNQHYQSCDDHAWGECVGKAKEVNYVYEVVQGKKILMRPFWPPCMFELLFALENAKVFKSWFICD